MTFRPYRDEDLEAVQRVWTECGWLTEDNAKMMPVFLKGSPGMVAEVHGRPECLVCCAPGRMMHRTTDLSACLITAVATSHVARQQGLAGRLTARALARDVEGGAVLATLGMFEQGFYNKLGFGTGPYERILEFDPSALRIPGGLRARAPHRLTTDDVDRMHAGAPAAPTRSWVGGHSSRGLDA